MTDVRTDVDERDVLVAAVGGKRRADQLESLLRRIRFDIHDARLEPGRLGSGNAVFDLLFARSGDQNLDLVGVRRRRTQDLEIEVDLIERERDVLVRLRLDRQFELLLFLAGRDDNAFGDNHRGREGHRDVAVAAAEAFPATAQPLRNLLHVRYIAVGDDVLRKRLDGVAFQAEPGLPSLGKLDQLDRRRRDVDADQGRGLGLEDVQRR